MASRRLQTMDGESAAAMALQALTFLAAEPARFGRFLALTGAGPSDIRAAAATALFQASVLDHLLADESLLLMFAAETGVDPDRIAPARAVLAAD